VRDAHGNESVARLEVRFRRIHILPPIGKQKRYPSLFLTVIHATERRPPPNRKPVDWKLLTDLPVADRAQAVEKLDWYALRWKIETYHKILKSGCRAEDLRLRSSERLVRMLALLCVVAWRVFWVSMLRRSAHDAPGAIAFTPFEIDLLRASRRPADSRPTLGALVVQLARLGGYLNRGRDGPPGNTVIWRGMRRLTDIALGYSMAIADVGNLKAHRMLTLTQFNSLGCIA
jgi:hypothetical protein